MSNLIDTLTLTANVGTIAASSVLNCSSQLTAGTYALWATTATVYVSTVYSSAMSLTNSLPVTVAQPQPFLVNVPYNGQLYVLGVAASSGVLGFMQVS